MTKKTKVLIVEDDKFILKAMTLKFESVGYTVKCAQTAEDGLVTLNSFEPNAIILDLLLPGADGYYFLNKVKNNDKFKDVPVIIASNLSDDTDIKKAMDLKASDYIVKSDLELDDLVQKISKYTK